MTFTSAQSATFDRLGAAFHAHLIRTAGAPRITDESGFTTRDLTVEQCTQIATGAVVELMASNSKEPDDLEEFERVLPLFECGCGGITATGAAMLTTSLLDRVAEHYERRWQEHEQQGVTQ